MALRRFHFLNPVIHSQTHTLKGWPGHRLVKIGLATRPSIAKWQFQNSFLFFLGIWVKLVALYYLQWLPGLKSKISGCLKDCQKKTCRFWFWDLRVWDALVDHAKIHVQTHFGVGFPTGTVRLELLMSWCRFNQDGNVVHYDWPKQLCGCVSTLVASSVGCLLSSTCSSV